MPRSGVLCGTLAAVLVAATAAAPLAVARPLAEPVPSASSAPTQDMRSPDAVPQPTVVPGLPVFPTYPSTPTASAQPTRDHDDGGIPAADLGIAGVVLFGSLAGIGGVIAHRRLARARALT
jgi:hypothetical protein